MIFKSPFPQLNRSTPLTYGLAEYLPFYEHVGSTTYDISGNDKHGVLTNMTDANWVSSPRGGALRFAASDYILVDPGLGYSADLAFAIWCKSSITNYTSSGYTIMQYDVGSGNREWGLLAVSASDKWGLQLGDGAGSAGWLYPTSQSVELGWHHLAITGNNVAKSWNFYYDGKFVETLYNSGADAFSDQGSTFTIGSPPGSSASFLGDIEEAAVWHRQLSASDIKLLYENPNAMTEAVATVWPNKRSPWYYRAQEELVICG